MVFEECAPSRRLPWGAKDICGLDTLPRGLCALPAKIFVGIVLVEFR
jgi:hypothetical protein